MRSAVTLRKKEKVGRNAERVEGANYGHKARAEARGKRTIGSHWNLKLRTNRGEGKGEKNRPSRQYGETAE